MRNNSIFTIIDQYHLWVPIILIIAFISFIAMIRIKMPGESFTGSIPPLTEAEQQDQTTLKKYVYFLAQHIGERNMHHHANLKQSANFIAKEFQSFGLKIDRQRYTVDNHVVQNIIATIPRKSHPHKIVIIGAHYDTVKGSPGADDNASGVAALLLLAKHFSKQPLDYTLRFVAFVNEESPYFYTRAMGSYQYAKMLKKRNEDIIVMLSLESLGYYNTAPNSQRYPYFFSLFYPNTADFIGFVSNFKNRNVLFRSIKTFRYHAKIPSYGIAAPTIVPGISWSDQWSFWKFGFPAIMIMTSPR